MSGLPGTGKTTIARRVATSVAGVHLRIDTIEAALKRSVLGIDPAEDAGYCVGYAVAADNLVGTAMVVADSVNPIALTRDAWAAVARAKRAGLVEVEVICSDPSVHRRRVEGRASDVDGLTLPTWRDVLERTYEPWSRARLVVDSATTSAQDAASRIVAAARAAA
ncbi:AAA family ATPase [Acuticoccus sp. 2012]|uniref:AAA family ATPase n=2 Tax=Acuticoccus mangrovi TaxID=2796142 RepID=A0A934MEQ2_9HYPH|nr:AAA family ATPase [Acuticoccus mangrovi]MBJ3774130.1 AAA family ATPase [Acuticoccus mangrovi]